ncbi:unnamed protein product [Caretta caretta]
MHFHLWGRLELELTSPGGKRLCTILLARPDLTIHFRFRNFICMAKQQLRAGLCCGSSQALSPQLPPAGPPLHQHGHPPLATPNPGWQGQNTDDPASPCPAPLCFSGFLSSELERHGLPTEPEAEPPAPHRALDCGFSWYQIYLPRQCYPGSAQAHQQGQ